MKSISDAIREEFTTLTTSLTSDINFKTLVHISILEQCGLMQKEEEQDECNYNTDNEPNFQEDIQQTKQKEQAELLRIFSEGASHKEQLKSISILIEVTGGWFEECL